MAQIKIEYIVEKLDHVFKNALTDTLKQTFPEQEFNEMDAFRTFLKMIGRRCEIWESVPDNWVDVK